MADGFNLDDFIGANADFARGYTFYVDLSAAPGVLFTDKTKFLVKSSSLPAGTITNAETNWQGNIYKLGATQEFSDFTVSFNVDKKGDVRRAFMDWLKLIHNPETNEHGNPLDYMIDINVKHISHIDGEPIAEYNLIKAFPQTVAELSLDYGSKDLATFDVTFTYQRHEQTK